MIKRELAGTMAKLARAGIGPTSGRPQAARAGVATQRVEGASQLEALAQKGLARGMPSLGGLSTKAKHGLDKLDALAQKGLTQSAPPLRAAGNDLKGLTGLRTAPARRAAASLKANHGAGITLGNKCCAGCSGTNPCKDSPKPAAFVSSSTSRAVRPKAAQSAVSPKRAGQPPLRLPAALEAARAKRVEAIAVLSRHGLPDARTRAGASSRSTTTGAKLVQPARLERAKAPLLLKPKTPVFMTRKGPGTNTDMVAEPIWFKNALWTAFDTGPAANVKFQDIAAGGGYVWAVSTNNELWVLRPGKTDFENTKQNAARVAALSTGTPVVVRSQGNSTSAKFSGFGGSAVSIGPFPISAQMDLTLGLGWHDLPANAIDVAAGNAWDTPGEPSYGDIIVSLFGTGILRVSDGAYLPTNGEIDRIAMTGNGNGQNSVWAISSSGDLYSGSMSGLTRVGTPWASSGDVGVDPQGAACVAQGSPNLTQPQGGDAWQQDRFGDRWLDTKGQARAIAAGPDGSMWIVGKDWKIYNRGGRKLGFWELERRSRPRPDQTWKLFFAESPTADAWTILQAIQDFLATGKLPPILEEAVARLVEGGASTLRLSQSFADPSGDVPISAPVELVIAAVLGIDVFLLFDIVRTGGRVVPRGSHWETDPFDTMINGFNKFFSKFVDGVNNLFSNFKLVQQFEDVIKYVSIGGEVDIYNNRHPGELVPFTTFYHGVCAHIRAITPRIKIGSVMSLHGDSGNNGAWELFNRAGKAPDETAPRLLNLTSDYVGFTSYPEQDFYLDYPDISEYDHNKYNYSISQRMLQMLEIAGEKAVVVEEFGYPSYDADAIATLQPGWPQHVFPASFYLQTKAGEAVQQQAVALAFDAWGGAGMQVPLFIWFTAFEMHVEGRGCGVLPGTVPLAVSCNPTGCQPVGVPVPPNGDPTYFGASCDPSVHSTCHLCGVGEGIDFLSTGGKNHTVDERTERFYGTCGLIHSNGVPKAAWNELVARANAERAPLGAM